MVLMHGMGMYLKCNLKIFKWISVYFIALVSPSLGLAWLKLVNPRISNGYFHWFIFVNIGIKDILLVFFLTRTYTSLRCNTTLQRYFERKPLVVKYCFPLCLLFFCSFVLLSSCPLVLLSSCSLVLLYSCPFVFLTFCLFALFSFFLLFFCSFVLSSLCSFIHYPLYIIH